MIPSTWWCGAGEEVYIWPILPSPRSHSLSIDIYEADIHNVAVYGQGNLGNMEWEDYRQDLDDR